MKKIHLSLLCLTLVLLFTALLTRPMTASADGIDGDLLNTFPAGTQVKIGTRTFKKLNPAIAGGESYVIQTTNELSRIWYSTSASNALQNWMNANGAGYYLNNTYLTALGVPDWISDTCWSMGVEGNEKSVFVKNKISLLSYSEYTAYKSIFGNPSATMWLRTAVASSTTNAWYVNTSGNLGPNSTSISYALFPAFYLKSNIGTVAGSSSPYNLELQVVSATPQQALVQPSVSELSQSFAPRDSVYSSHKQQPSGSNYSLISFAG